MISNNFVIPKTFYANASLAVDLNQIDLSLFCILKNSYGINESTKQISEIIAISDLDYSDIIKTTTSILRQCLIRSSFLLITDEIVSDMNYKFHKFVESKKYLEKYQTNYISKQLVINCFKGVKRDRNKQRVLSLEYRKN